MSTTMKPTEAGTAFLTTPVSESAEKIFTLEQRDEEQRWIEESAATFLKREVLPKVDAIDHQEPGLMPSLLKQAGEQGQQASLLWLTTSRGRFIKARVTWVRDHFIDEAAMTFVADLLANIRRSGPLPTRRVH